MAIQVNRSILILLVALQWKFHNGDPLRKKEQLLQQVSTEYGTTINFESTTFKVCDKHPNPVQRYWNLDGDRYLATYLSQYQKNNCSRIIQGTNFSTNANSSSSIIEPAYNNGFVNTIIQAYNQHHNLILRPDDIWTAIISQFALYVNANSEKYRKHFVNFDGKKELEVSLGSSYGIDNAPYNKFVELMTNQINENLVDEEKIKEWILPNFTTTTKDDKVTTGVIFMATTKKYFDYKFTLECGIPQMTIQGDVRDWQEIRNRLEKLKQFDLAKWVDLLEPILNQFVKTVSGEGEIDLDFWNRIVTYSPGGSGDDFISGWLTAFSVFNEDGKWIGNNIPTGQSWPEINTDDITSGVAEVYVTINDNGVEYKSVMFGGHMAKEIHGDSVTLQPRSGWAIAQIKSPE